MRKLYSLMLSLQLLLATALGLSCELAAQGKPTDANIIGHVTDAKTGEHLAGITIAIKGTTFGTATDATGHYFLKNLKQKSVTLVMRGLGYLSQERVIEISPDKVIEVNFEAEQDNINIDEVVVSSNRQATLRRLAPTLVTVLDSKLFESANATNLAQGLIFQPGVRVENNCQNCGFNQVRINGLDGRYSQILIDSRPIMNALAGVYGLEQIPTNMIERVEVVRGGGSALFGSSAIAGVINIITKEPQRNSFTFNESMSFSGFKDLDNNLSFNGSLVSDDNRAGAMVFAQARYRKEHDVNGDGYSELGRLDSRSLGFRGYFRPSDYTRLTGEVHTFSEARRGGDHIDWPEQVAGVAESIRHSVYSGNLKFDGYSEDYKHHYQLYTSAQYITRNSYYGGIGEPKLRNKAGDKFVNAQGVEIDSEADALAAGAIGRPIHTSDYGKNFGITRGFTWVGGAQYTYDFDHFLFMPAQFLAGAEYSYDRLDDRMPLREWETEKTLSQGFDLAANPVSLSPALHQVIRNASQFAQIEWKNDRWSLLLGTRLDENSAVKKAIFSPRATLRYNPTKNFNIRATYAKGFRAPQVFDEDLHVGVVGGEAQRVTNADDLRPEISHSFSLSNDMYFTLGEAQLNLLAEGFYTRLLDVFTNYKDKSENGISYYTRHNYGIDDNGQQVSSGAKILGLNLEGKIAYRWLSLQAGLTLTSNKYDVNQEWGVRQKVKGNHDAAYYDTFVPKADGSDFDNVAADGEAQTISMTSKNITRTPSTYGYFTIGINPVRPLNIALTGTFTGSMYVPHVVKWGQNSAVTDRAAIAAGLRHEGDKLSLVDESGVPVQEDGAPKKVDIEWNELVKTKSFFDLGTKITYDLRLFSKTNLQLYCGVNNLFNAFQSDYDFGPDRDSGYIYGPTIPRSGYFGLKFTF
ncbi:TonB-dependent receptor [Porphyromonas sp.]